MSEHGAGAEILVGYDGSPDAAAALEWALDQARRDGRRSGWRTSSSG